MSVGVLATSDSELSMSVTDAPRPLAPPVKMSSSDESWLARVLSIDDTEAACVACVVRKSLWARSMVETSTPLPM